MPFPDGTADFRSDTVTRPTEEMRRAMASAPVGDDVYSDDPTVNALEEEAAAATGKEKAVFVPTGTMGNQLSVMVQTHPGEEVIVDERAHIRNVEQGWGPAHAGVGWRTVPTDGGRILPQQVDSVMELAGTMFPRVGLLAWENTHNLSGGRVVPLDVMRQTSERARLHGLGVHIDGARIFNAAVAGGAKASDFAACADTIQFCFSKGLGAPIGSIVCGPTDLMSEVRYRRERLGGAMRQVGIIAAAARIALRDWERLAEDHDLARLLAGSLAGRWPGTVSPDTIETNMVNVAAAALPAPMEAIKETLSRHGIVTGGVFAGNWRLVTHRDVDGDDVGRLISAIAEAGEAS
ncbi:MAG: GntG family PLP-dependent aldolase [Acidimicrobiia bacterium]